MIAQIPVDAILTDINMPDMTGLELIRRARKELPRVKAVIISGTVNLNMQERQSS